tara:strand:+ start:4986 stop:6197 length:1212 start_codon:yes stop_codon:yes gene_type:complete
MSAIQYIVSTMPAVPHDSLVFLIFVVFAGAAVLTTLALYTRQSMLVAYMLLGFLVGPFELKLVPDAHMVSEVGEIGIIFLLFLLGLHLQPKSLINLLRRTMIVTVASSVAFAIISYVVTFYFAYTHAESIIIAAALLFSSTIIGLKLLPTTVLHHRHTGDVMISVLLLQDLIAIIVLLAIRSAGTAGGTDWHEVLTIVLGFPALIAFAFLFERYVLMRLLRRFNHIKEYIFLLPIGWCLSLVVAAKLIGLSPEVGAFIAGVALAEHPISQYIAENLKPLRDFFLIAFFFSIGATFDPHYLGQVIIPATILAVCILVLKPVIYRYLLVRSGEESSVAWEVGFRLGQASEFSLLVAYLAANSHLISEKASYLIQAATIMTFIFSSYFIVARYPTPVATSEKLRRD